MDSPIKQLIRRMDLLEKRTEDHLLDASGVKADLTWLKKAVWLIASVVVTNTVANLAGLIHRG